jgi:hypothetical protein
MVAAKPPKKYLCAICGKKFPESEIVLLGGVYYCIYHPKVLKDWERRLKSVGKKKRRPRISFAERRKK